MALRAAPAPPRRRRRERRIATARAVALALAAVCVLLAGGVACRERPDDGAGATPVTATAGTASGTGMPVQSPSILPEEYGPLALWLADGLAAWERALDAAPAPARPRAPVFGAHVLAANGNRGEALLAPATIDVLDLTLERLEQLGVGGVTVTISFPLFNEHWPRADEYLAFYGTVAAHVRARGLTFTVEQHVAFVGTEFSPIVFDYAALTFDEFVARFAAMTRLIVERLQPDYLTLLSEPDTFARLTGYDEASTPAGAAAMIAGVIDGLDRGATKLGAGASSWLPDAPEYAAAFAALPLDYIDLHIYPVTQTTVGLIERIAGVAEAAGKPLVLDEAWLYKVGPGDGATAGFALPTEAFRRDAFSFWSPLDSRFLELLARFARTHDVAYLAPFWSTLFWGSVDYGPDTADLPYGEVARRTNGAALAAMLAGTFTPTGEAYRRAIAPRR